MLPGWSEEIIQLSYLASLTLDLSYWPIQNSLDFSCGLIERTLNQLPVLRSRRGSFFWILGGSLDSDPPGDWKSKRFPREGSQTGALLGQNGFKKLILPCLFPLSSSHLLLAHFTCATNCTVRKIYLLSGQIPLLSLEGAHNPLIYTQAVSGPTVKKT